MPASGHLAQVRAETNPLPPIEMPPPLGCSRVRRLLSAIPVRCGAASRSRPVARSVQLSRMDDWKAAVTVPTKPGVERLQPLQTDLPRCGSQLETTAGIRCWISDRRLLPSADSCERDRLEIACAEASS